MGAGSKREEHHHKFTELSVTYEETGCITNSSDSGYSYHRN
jgi:hypothetical protein